MLVYCSLTPGHLPIIGVSGLFKQLLDIHTYAYYFQVYVFHITISQLCWSDFT